MRQEVVLAIGILAVALALRLGSVAAQEGPLVATDAPSYLVGETAHVTVTGLSACASQEVMIGFFGPGASPVLTTTATVGVDGTVATDIAITFGGFSNFAGAAAECIPGGSVLSEDLISLLVPDPPAAPETGVGVASGHNPSGWQSTLAGVGIAVMVAGVLALAVVRKRTARPALTPPG
jgi:hypothetical protein